MENMKIVSFRGKKRLLDDITFVTKYMQKYRDIIHDDIDIDTLIRNHQKIFGPIGAS